MNVRVVPIAGLVCTADMVDNPGRYRTRVA